MTVRESYIERLADAMCDGSDESWARVGTASEIERIEAELVVAFRIVGDCEISDSQSKSVGGTS